MPAVALSGDPAKASWPSPFPRAPCVTSGHTALAAYMLPVHHPVEPMFPPHPDVLLSLDVGHPVRGHASFQGPGYSKPCKGDLDLTWVGLIIFAKEK